MENNFVRLKGTVKRDASANAGVMDFALCVIGAKGRVNFFDCRVTQQSKAFRQLEGFVNVGEEIELVGHLEKRTWSEGQKLAGVTVDVQHTVIFVLVDDIIETED